MKEGRWREGRGGREGERVRVEGEKGRVREGGRVMI